MPGPSGGPGREAPDGSSGPAFDEVSGGRFDVFLSHNRADHATVLRLGAALRDRGLRPWLDTWELVPGVDWQDGLIGGLYASASCAVFLSARDLGDWQRPEVKVALDRSAHDPDFRVFLVLLPGVPDPFDPTSIDPFLSMRTWVDLRVRVEGADPIHRLTRAVQGLPLGTPWTERDAAEPVPYRGLRSFREEDHGWFFGRDRDIQRLVEKLKHRQFLAVVGPSGSGKSSLTLAGLLPRLREGAVPGSESWAIVTFTPGARPLESLAAAMLRVYPELPAPAVLSELATGDTALSLRLRGGDRPVVLVVDQAEESFTQCDDDEARRRFFGNLLQASAVGGPGTVIITMRADFYPHTAHYPSLAQALATHQYLVGPLERDAVRQVIEQPARLAGLSLQPGLVDAIVHDVGAEPGALPLLEHTLFELWERRRGHTLTLDALAEVGGVAGALSRRADLIWESFTPEEQTAARQVLLRLSHPGEGTADTKRPALLDDIPTAQISASTVEHVVHILSDARLLTTSTGNRGTVVEVSHEALIRAWPRLREWIVQDRDDITTRERISAAASEWLTQRDPDSLWKGTRLSVAMEWFVRHQTSLNEGEVEFLRASHRAQTSAQRRRRTRVLAVVIALALLTATATLTGIRARDQADQARANEREAQALALAAASLSVPESNSALALALGAESAIKTETPLARSTAALTQARLAFDSARVQQMPFSIAAEVGYVSSLAFSPDGALVAVGGTRGVQLWRATGAPELEALEGRGVPVNSIVFSPGGSLLIAGGNRGMQFWNPATGDRLEAPIPQVTRVAALAVSRAGTLAIARWGASLQLWDIATWTRVGGRPRGGKGRAKAVGFSPDGTKLTYSDENDRVHVWDFVRGVEASGQAQGDGIDAVMFTADGRSIATSGSGGAGEALRWWDAETLEPRGRPLQRLDIAVVYSMALSRRSRLVVTGGADGELRLWDLVAGAPVGGRLPGHTSDVEAVSFDSNGTTFASADDHGNVVLWEANPARDSRPTVRAGDAADAVAIAPDGSLVASAGARWRWEKGSTPQSEPKSDYRISFWDPRTHRQARRPLHQRSQVFAIAFSADGRSLASAADDGRITLWDLTRTQPTKGGFDASFGMSSLSSGPAGQLAWSTWGNHVGYWDPSRATRGRRLLPLAPRERVGGVALSADGQLLVAGGGNANLNGHGWVHVWDVSNGRPVEDRQFHVSRAILNVAVDMHQERLAVGDVEGRIWLWNLINGDLVSEAPLTHGATLNAIAFSPDGKLLASAADDGSFRLWDPSTGDAITPTLQAFPNAVTSIAFSPRDNSLVLASLEGLVRWLSWEPNEACAIAGRFVTATEVESSMPLRWSPACGYAN